MGWRVYAVLFSAIGAWGAADTLGAAPKAHQEQATSGKSVETARSDDGTAAPALDNAPAPSGRVPPQIAEQAAVPTPVLTRTAAAWRGCLL